MRFHGSRFTVEGLWFRGLGSGFKVRTAKCRAVGTSPLAPAMQVSSFRLQVLGFRVLGFLDSRVSGFRLDSGFRALVYLGSWVSGFGHRVSGLGFQASGLRFGVWGFRLEVSGFRFRVSGFRFRVSGFRFRVILGSDFESSADLHKHLGWTSGFQGSKL